VLQFLHHQSEQERAARGLVLLVRRHSLKSPRGQIAGKENAYRIVETLKKVLLVPVSNGEGKTI